MEKTAVNRMGMVDSLVIYFNSKKDRKVALALTQEGRHHFPERNSAVLSYLHSPVIRPCHN